MAIIAAPPQSMYEARTHEIVTIDGNYLFLQHTQRAMDTQ